MQSKRKPARTGWLFQPGGFGRYAGQTTIRSLIMPEMIQLNISQRTGHALMAMQRIRRFGKESNVPTKKDARELCDAAAKNQPTATAVLAAKMGPVTNKIGRAFKFLNDLPESEATPQMLTLADAMQWANARMLAAYDAQAELEQVLDQILAGEKPE